MKPSTPISLMLAACFLGRDADAACAANLKNCETCTGAESTTCEGSCNAPFDMQGIDKSGSATGGMCDCQNLPATVNYLFQNMQGEVCSVARLGDAVTTAAALSTQESDAFWAKTLLGCTGPTENSLLVHPVGPPSDGRIGTAAATGPCYPDEHLRRGAVLHGLENQLYTVGNTATQSCSSATGSVRFTYTGTAPVIVEDPDSSQFSTGCTVAFAQGTASVAPPTLDAGTPNTVERGPTLRNCGMAGSLIIQFKIESLVEATGAWSSAGEVGNIAITPDSSTVLSRACNLANRIAAISLFALTSDTSITALVHGSVMKDAGNSISSMNLATLTGNVNAVSLPYWNEGGEKLSSSKTKQVGASQVKITAGMTKFPWSSTATDESRGCVAIEIGAVTASAGVANSDESATLALAQTWLDTPQSILYIPVMSAASGSDMLTNYEDCKKQGSGAACEASKYVVADFSKYMLVNPTGSAQVLFEAEYTYDGASRKLHICAPKSQMGANEFVIDPVTQIGAGPSAPSDSTTVASDSATVAVASGAIKTAPVFVFGASVVWTMLRELF